MDSVTITSLGAVAAAGLAAGKILWQKIDALSATIGKTYDDQISSLRVDLTECREEHKRADVKIDAVNMRLLEMTATVGKLEGRIEGYNESQIVITKRQHDIEEQLDSQEHES